MKKQSFSFTNISNDFIVYGNMTVWAMVIFFHSLADIDIFSAMLASMIGIILATPFIFATTVATFIVFAMLDAFICILRYAISLFKRDKEQIVTLPTL